MSVGYRRILLFANLAVSLVGSVLDMILVSTDCYSGISNIIGGILTA